MNKEPKCITIDDQAKSMMSEAFIMNKLNRVRLDTKFYTAWLALGQAEAALKEALKECREAGA